MAEIVKPDYKKSPAKVLNLWRVYHRKYTMVPKKYKELEPQAAGLPKALGVLSKKEVKNFPVNNLEVLLIENEEDVIEFIENNSPKKLEEIADAIEDLRYNRVYRDMKARIEDWEPKIKEKNGPRKINYGSGRVTVTPRKKPCTEEE